MINKRILYITAFPPCKKTGGQYFSLNAINELSKKYLVDLMYFSYSGHECEVSLKSIDEKKTTKIEFNVSRYNFLKYFWIHPTFSRRFDKKILGEIQSISSQYDILYFDFTQVGLYSLYIQHPHKILRVHDVLFQKYNRKNFLIAKWVKNTEQKILKSVTQVFVPSIKDVELIDKLYGIKALFTHEYLKDIQFNEFIEQKKQFVFYGYWKRKENTDGLVWFIRKVLPLPKSQLDLVVIGGGLNKKIEEKFLKPNSIKYLGFVNNPLEIIAQSSAVLVPLFQGAGVKVKVVDSFTVGTPVIGTELAFEGIPDVSGLSFCATNEIEFVRFIESFKILSYEQKQDYANKFRKLYDNHHLLEQIELLGDYTK